MIYSVIWDEEPAIWHHRLIWEPFVFAFCHRNLVANRPVHQMDFCGLTMQECGQGMALPFATTSQSILAACMSALPRPMLIIKCHPILHAIA